MKTLTDYDQSYDAHDETDICQCNEGLCVYYTHRDHSDYGIGYHTVFCPNCDAIDRVIYDDDLTS